jgi:hypothetical protein
MFGRKNTDRLFPQVHSSSVDDNVDEEEAIDETPVAAV